jgi:hypothetical protein
VTTALGDLLAWSMYVGLALAAVAFVVGAGMAAIGANAARPDMAERGKRAALWALVGAALIGMAVFLVNTFYDLGGNPADGGGGEPPKTKNVMGPTDGGTSMAAGQILHLVGRTAAAAGHTYLNLKA